MTDQVGDWTVVRKLGDGSMGIVYEARNSAGDRGALKMLRPEHASNVRLNDRFKRESHLLQKLQDRNVVRLLAVGEQEGQIFIVLEFIDGPPLEDLLKTNGPLKGDDARQLAIDLLRGLHAVHSAGLVHRDVKPSNIMLGRDGCWKLTDFGLARREGAEESIAVTRQGAVLGTPHYMAPEQCEGAGAEPRSDLYAVGATLFQAYTGQTVFEKPTFMEVISAQIREPPRPVQGVATDLPPDLGKLVDRLLKKKKEDRPATAAEALKLIGAAPLDTLAPTSADLARFHSARTLADEDEGQKPVPLPVIRKETTRSFPRSAELQAPGTTTTKRRRASELLATPDERLAPLREDARRRTSSRLEVSVPTFAREKPSQAWKATRAPIVAAVGVVVLTVILKRNTGLLIVFGVSREEFAARWPLVGTVLVSALIVLAAARYLWVYATENAPENATLRSPLERLRGRMEYARTRERNPRRAAELLRALGASTNAGQVLVEAGRFAEAGAEFLSAGQPHVAALAFERAGLLDKARDAYVASNELDQAARVAAEAGQDDVAGDLYLACGRTSKAIDAFRRAEKTHRVLELLEQQGAWTDAAAEIMLTIEKREKARGIQASEKKNLYHRAGELCLKANHIGQAAGIFELAGELERSLELYEQVGDHGKAGDVAAALGDRLRAAGHFEKAGREKDAARARADHFAAHGDPGSAARELERLNEMSRAASLYEQAGILEDAARCALKAGDEERAAAIWLVSGEAGKAAAIFEKLGRNVEAANAWKKAGDLRAAGRAFERAAEPIKAAEAYLAVGSRAEALRVLQAVPASSEHRNAALGYLGDLHAESGRDTEAMVAYTKALEGAVLDELVVKRTLTLSEVLARLGHTNRAISTLKHIQGSPYAPADLEARIEVISVGVSAPRRSATSSGRLRRLRGRDLVGTEIDRYKLLGFLGEGGTAWIYKAEHAFLGRVAALKLLKAHPEEDPELVSRFLAEGRAVATLRHPNLIEVYDFGQTEDQQLYMALEFVSGGSIRDVISRGEKLSVARLARLGADVLAGLAAAHRKGIVHRDLKPENILLDDTGRPKIVDFGIAKMLTTKDSSTADFLGTPRYASPEQALGKQIGPAADQYAFGVIFYELAASRLPFESATAVGWLNLHAQGKPMPLSEVAPNLPPRLAAAIMRCLEKDPAARWPDLETLQRVFASAAF